MSFTAIPANIDPKLACSYGAHSFVLDERIPQQPMMLCTVCGGLYVPHDWQLETLREDKERNEMSNKTNLSTKINKNTIDDLKKAGYKVFITHRRIWEQDVRWVTKNVFKSEFDWDGHSVMVPHRRTPLRSFKEAVDLWGRDNLTPPVPYGGETTVTITHPDGTELEGKAPCSMMDRFNRRLGLYMALGRAIKLLKQYEAGELQTPKF